MYVRYVGILGNNLPLEKNVEIAKQNVIVAMLYRNRIMKTMKGSL